MLKHIQSSENWQQKNLAAKGFTLIELLVVVIILGILAAVAIFAVGNLTDKATENTCKTELSTLKTAIQAYKANSASGTSLPSSVNQLLETATPPGNLDSTPKYYTVTTAGAPALTAAGTSANCAAP